jgi:hypothetical protein
MTPRCIRVAAYEGGLRSAARTMASITRMLATASSTGLETGVVKDRAREDVD